MALAPFQKVGITNEKEISISLYLTKLSKCFWSLFAWSVLCYLRILHNKEVLKVHRNNFLIHVPPLPEKPLLIPGKKETIPSI